MTLLAAAMALSTLQRPPVVVPSVRIVSLGGPSRLAQPAKAAPRDVAPTPAVEAQPAPPRPEETKSKAPPEKLPAKPATKNGTAPKPPDGIVSKTKGQPKPPKVETAAGTESARNATAAAAAPASGVGFETDADDPGPLAGYLALVRDKVASAWAAPVVVGQKGEVRAVIYFVIERTGGSPQDLAVAVSSGDSGFDRAAMRAVLNAAPLAPLPATWGTESIGIRFTFYQSY
jgi:TonB family protein